MKLIKYFLLPCLLICTLVGVLMATGYIQKPGLIGPGGIAPIYRFPDFKQIQDQIDALVKQKQMHEEEIAKIQQQIEALKPIPGKVGLSLPKAQQISALENDKKPHEAEVSRIDGEIENLTKQLKKN
ncbi:TPA: hypothetical protein DEO28_02205 [Candidatus Dependentiae bacterium]|nr:MAG: hypothetical protein UR14_C0009G0012 [candidate division TM6 bacterium GW2011_GWE2_31_21]KKP52547.1 MAG: hypothetical protein UR43_C0012G0016 [candidate division TM6 bacterium GW2011_GWF2_33_332]HBS48453.1 hypothetical protein [Candidatus Dependentiae bacterium]HBZ73302.1 hypothetical protein [Candidatus Dependentiae bacterium]